MMRKQITNLASRVPGLLFLLLLVLGVYYLWSYLHLPSVPAEGDDGTNAPRPWPELQSPPASAWDVFVGEGGSRSGNAGDLAKRFRLAGTFFMEGGTPEGKEQRNAVLDDLQDQTQLLVGEGERVGDGAEVVEIQRDRIVLRMGAQEETLWLSFSNPEPAVADAGGSTNEVPWDERVLEENRFGKRIAENRWILSREELLRYREDLLDDPERLAQLFISMKPARTAGKINGYRLQKEGENEFYDAIGLSENDVIRKVNSMRMSRQERAEYFIREFVGDRLSAVVLDIERDGKPTKLIYYLR